MGFVVGACGVEVGASGVCVAVGVTLGCGGIEVSVTGGVTRRSNCCPGRMMEVELRPEQESQLEEI